MERRAHAVWEITLACNLACGHCGSRAGRKRTRELSTRDALDVVRQRAEIGVDEVTLIGGEAFLRPDWPDLARAISEAGMLCSMVTGGYGISGRTAERMAETGVRRVSVSVDGLEGTHDELRGRPGSWRACFSSMRELRRAGVEVGCNTQINRLTAAELPDLYRLLREAGTAGWQRQMTVPMGRAADRPEILLQPAELPATFDLLARLARRARQDGIRAARQQRGLLRTLRAHPGGRRRALALGRVPGREEHARPRGGRHGQGLSLPAHGRLRRRLPPRDAPARPRGQGAAAGRPGGAAVGLLRDLRARGPLPGRMHLDRPRVLRSPGQQPVLPPSGPGAGPAGRGEPAHT